MSSSRWERAVADPALPRPQGHSESQGVGGGGGGGPALAATRGEGGGAGGGGWGGGWEWVDRGSIPCLVVCLLKAHGGVSLVAQWVKNLASIHEVAGLIPGLAQCVNDLVLP